MKIYYDKDANLDVFKGKKVAVIGYGSQGHAHANNLKDSGFEVIVAEYPQGGENWTKAEKAGHQVMMTADAVKAAEVIMVLLTDEMQADIYNAQIAPHIKPGSYIGFAHGFNIHYNQIVPAEDINIFMVAPKGPGHTVRNEYVQGGGVPCLIAVEKDPSGNTKDIAMAYELLKHPSVRKLKPTYSESRLFCAVERLPWSRPDTKCWSKPVMLRKWPISSAYTN